MRKRSAEENSLGPFCKNFCSAPDQYREVEQPRHAKNERGCSRRDNSIKFQEIQHGLPPPKNANGSICDQRQTANHHQDSEKATGSNTDFITVTNSVIGFAAC